jgi:hypothetical protein
MKGFPKTMATNADLLNCLALVQAGELHAADLTAAVAAIEEREYITIPILEMSTDRKTVIVADCAELAAGVAIENTPNATATATINAVQRAAATLAPVSGGKVTNGTVTTPVTELPISDGKSTLDAGTAPVSEPETAAPEAAQIRATLTLSKALPTGATTMRVKALRNPFEELGTTREKITAIKEVLKQL